MNYHRILKYDTANGPGIRTTIWFTGCCFHCDECFNSAIRDFNTGKAFDDKAKETLLEYLSDPHVKGLSVLGGEPLIQSDELTELLKEVKELYPEKDIWMWTGFQLKDIMKELECEVHHDTYMKYLKRISYVDYLVDGPYKKNETAYHTRFRGSSNQIIWKIMKTANDKDPDFDTHTYYATNVSYAYDNHKEALNEYEKITDQLILIIP